MQFLALVAVLGPTHVREVLEAQVETIGGIVDDLNHESAQFPLVDHVQIRRDFPIRHQSVAQILVPRRNDSLFLLLAGQLTCEIFRFDFVDEPFY